jgi:hypothetical protein
MQEKQREKCLKTKMMMNEGDSCDRKEGAGLPIKYARMSTTALALQCRRELVSETTRGAADRIEVI